MYLLTLLMKQDTLKAVSPIDGRYYESTSPLNPYVSEYALIYFRIEIEIRYLEALSKVGVIRKFSVKELKLLREIYELKSEGEANKVKEIEDKVRHDVKAVEIYLREKLKTTSLKDVIEYLHFALTSEDINNIAYRLTLKRGFESVVLPKYKNLLKSILDFSEENIHLPMLARTHGQDAIPTTLGKETCVFAIRLYKEIKKIEKLKLTGKLSGAVGTYASFTLTYPKTDWIKFTKNFIESFDLEFNIQTTQINPLDDIVEYLQTLHRINSILLGFNQDMWRYISDGWLTQKVDKTSVGSSTMAQKINPINFENSEGNIQVVNSLIEGLVRSLPISRLQRDLSGSTVIRNTSTILAHEILIFDGTLKGISKVKANHELITTYLTSNYSILSEAAQIILRKHGIKDGYEVIKQKTMGEEMSRTEWEQMINGLDISKKVKDEILSVTPLNYLGYSEKITKSTINQIRKYLIL